MPQFPRVSCQHLKNYFAVIQGHYGQFKNVIDIITSSVVDSLRLTKMQGSQNTDTSLNTLL